MVKRNETCRLKIHLWGVGSGKPQTVCQRKYINNSINVVNNKSANDFVRSKWSARVLFAYGKIKRSHVAQNVYVTSRGTAFHDTSSQPNNIHSVLVLYKSNRVS